MTGLLEVTVWHDQDVLGAQEGGADRLFLLAPAEDDIGLSPDVPTVAAILRGSSVPVRVCLRLNDSLTTTGGEFTRLIGLGEEFLALGAEGLTFGFLNPFLEIDTDTCAALATALPGVPWTFHHAFDAALDPGRAWRRVQTLPGLTSVHSGGSPQGLGHGYDDLLTLAEGDLGIARLLTASGGLTAEQVTWFARAGVTQFHVAEQVRPTGGATPAYVDARLVRSWRLLVDSATERSRPA